MAESFDPRSQPPRIPTETTQYPKRSHFENTEQINEPQDQTYRNRYNDSPTESKNYRNESPIDIRSSHNESPQERRYTNNEYPYNPRSAFFDVYQANGRRRTSNEVLDSPRSETTVSNRQGSIALNEESPRRETIKRRPVPDRTRKLEPGLIPRSEEPTPGLIPREEVSPKPAADKRTIRGDSRQISNIIDSIKNLRNNPQLSLIGILLAAFLVLYQILPASDEAVTGISPSSPIIVVMGETGAGKSSFIKALGGRNMTGDLPQVGHNLNATTKEVIWYSATTTKKAFYILDTPGFDDSFLTDFEILELLAKELANMYKQKRSVNGIIYLHDISKEKMGGASHKSLRTFQKLIGDTSLKNVVLGTTHWSYFPSSASVRREKELKDIFWDPMILLGSTMKRHDGSKKSARKIVDTIIDNQPVVPKIVEELVKENKPLGEADAGKFVGNGIDDMRGKLDEQLTSLNQVIEGLRKDFDTRSEEDKQKWEKLISQLENDKNQLQKQIIELRAANNRLKEDIDRNAKPEERIIKSEIEKLREDIIYLNNKLLLTNDDLKTARLRDRLTEISKRIDRISMKDRKLYYGSVKTIKLDVDYLEKKANKGIGTTGNTSVASTEQSSIIWRFIKRSVLIVVEIYASFFLVVFIGGAVGLVSPGNDKTFGVLFVLSFLFVIWWNIF